MDESRYIEALKNIKKVRDENKKSVEKIRNTNLDEKKKIISCIVNTEIIIKLIKDGILFDPRGNNGKLVWINNDIELDLIHTINLLRDKLNTDSDQ